MKFTIQSGFLMLVLSLIGCGYTQLAPRQSESHDPSGEGGIDNYVLQGDSVYRLLSDNFYILSGSGVKSCDQKEDLNLNATYDGWVQKWGVVLHGLRPSPSRGG